MPAGPHSCVGGIHADLGRAQCACFRSWRRRRSSCHRNDSGTMVPAGCGARSCARWWQSQPCRLRRPVATKRPSAHLSTRSPADVPATIGLCHDQDTWPRFQRGGRRSRRTGLPKECCAQPRAGAGRGSDGLDGLLVHAPGLRGGGLSADVQRHQRCRPVDPGVPDRLPVLDVPRLTTVAAVGTSLFLETSGFGMGVARYLRMRLVDTSTCRTVIAVTLPLGAAGAVAARYAPVDLLSPRLWRSDGRAGMAALAPRRRTAGGEAVTGVVRSFRPVPPAVPGRRGPVGAGGEWNGVSLLRPRARWAAGAQWRRRLCRRSDLHRCRRGHAAVPGASLALPGGGGRRNVDGDRGRHGRGRVSNPFAPAHPGRRPGRRPVGTAGVGGAGRAGGCHPRHAAAGPGERTGDEAAFTGLFAVMGVTFLLAFTVFRGQFA